MTPGNRFEAFISGFDDPSSAQRIYEWGVETFFVAADTADDITFKYSLDVASIAMDEGRKGVLLITSQMPSQCLHISRVDDTPASPYSASRDRRYDTSSSRRAPAMTSGMLLPSQDPRVHLNPFIAAAMN